MDFGCGCALGFRVLGLRLKNDMNRPRLFLLLMALLLVALSWYGVVVARAGLVVRSLEQDGLPMLYLHHSRERKYQVSSWRMALRVLSS